MRGAQLCARVRTAVEEGQGGEVEPVLAEFADDPEVPPHGKVLLAKLQAVLAGSRDPELAEDPDLDYDDAAELMLLLESLGG